MAKIYPEEQRAYELIEELGEIQGPLWKLNEETQS